MLIDFQKISTRDSQHYLQHAIAPRPICFASTINVKGEVNLSPFSFFNVFSSNPPIVVFSPSRRARNNTTKDTYKNILEVPEVAINIVDFDMLQQMSLSSCEYPSGINEFTKAGLRMLTSNTIKPPRVLESKISMECKVTEVKPLGNQGGAGILVIAEVLLMHVDDEILDKDRLIDPRKIKQVARLGGDWYMHVQPEIIYKVPKPVAELGIGVDKLPAKILQCPVFTGNHFGALANVSSIPERDDDFDDDVLHDTNLSESAFAMRITALLDAGDVQSAWQLVLRF
ncbi:flavin reductase family protein [Sphingobacterium corticibacter]|uniref:Flavin reductase n=1 Tax=Sphingobacterium corticibacter TaxID=2171749 RepID=A0A2T8HLM7_9SPHI|nr:flavin reductase family protein [Sphingobacterium corticibacter]PVH26336.1 flavin reductase [Sphingobacterium corticibacter]